MIGEFLSVFFYIIFAHSLADYPLQGDFLAQGKNRNTDLGKIFWPYALSSHSIIHGGFVFMITHNIFLGVAETLIHAVTDWLKCGNKINMLTDQIIHYLCKVIWALIFINLK